MLFPRVTFAVCAWVHPRKRQQWSLSWAACEYRYSFTGLSGCHIWWILDLNRKNSSKTPTSNQHATARAEKESRPHDWICLFLPQQKKQKSHEFKLVKKAVSSIMPAPLKALLSLLNYSVYKVRDRWPRSPWSSAGTSGIKFIRSPAVLQLPSSCWVVSVPRILMWPQEKLKEHK